MKQSGPRLQPEKYRHDLEVVQSTARQVVKDFGLAGITIEFSGNPASAYSELLSQVLPALRYLYNENRNAFMSLLYRIDVEEKKVKQLAAGLDEINFYVKLTELVIEREFMKVLIRKLFSQRDG